MLSALVHCDCYGRIVPPYLGQVTVFGLAVHASKEQVRRRLGAPEQDSGTVWTYRGRGVVIYYGAYGWGKIGVERFYTPQLEVDGLSTVKVGMSPCEVSTVLGKPIFENSQMLRSSIGLDVIEARLDQKTRVESMVLKRHTTPPPQP